MKKKILAFGASSSKQSINKKLARFAASQFPNADVSVLDLNDFEMPIYSMDKEREGGVPELAVAFQQHIHAADAIVVSFAEHNGAYSAAFKNIFDWVSRLDSNVWQDKPMLLMATSPGGRGGKTVLDIALNKFKFMNKSVLASFSLPSFHQNFTEEAGIVDADLLQELMSQIQIVSEAV